MIPFDNPSKSRINIPLVDPILPKIAKSFESASFKSTATNTMNFQMISSVFFIVVFANLNASIAASVGAAKTVIRHVVQNSDEDFCYEEEETCGPKHWDGYCNTDIHKHQSPIDIKVNPDDFQDSFQTVQFSRSYSETFDSFYIENNGHSIQISLNYDDDDEDSRKLSFTYGQNASSYVFSQIHFHWGSSLKDGSEHTINSTSFPMEIHLVHHLAKYEEVEDALEDISVQDSLSVLGVFVEVKPDCSTSSIFEPIAESMKTMVGKPSEKVKVNKPLKLSSFLPETLDFFGYYGSLTTPTCAEAVRWAVIQKPICISPQQLEVFRSVEDVDGDKLVTNHRPVQPLGDRVVRFFRVRELEQPGDGDSSSSVQIQNNFSTCAALLLALNIIFLHNVIC